MRYSLYDITFLFVQKFYAEDPGHEVKIEILKDFKELLNLGWVEEDIFRVLKNANSRPNIKTMMRGRPNNQNLINPNSFYYHNELRVLPPPPKRTFDIESGEIIKSNTDEEFFMEMRASYTTADLIDYFVRVFKLEHSNPNQLQGAFRYILKDASIEEVLFMIDAASDNTKSGDRDRSQMTPFRIVDYRNVALVRRTEKETACRLSGSDKIVPKRRVLLF